MAFSHSALYLVILEYIEILCIHLFIHSFIQLLLIESNVVLYIVLGAEGTAVKWKDKVSVLVTDEAGRRKQGWNLDLGFYLKSNIKYLKVLDR